MPEADRRHRDVVVALVGEDAQLGRYVILVAGVAVEVIGREVEQRRGLGRERGGVLELKRRGLADDRRLGRQLSDQRGGRGPDVAGHGHRQPGLAVDVGDPLGRRRLAVGPGHADELVLEQAPGELELAQDGNATTSRDDDRRGSLGHSGALDERSGPAGGGNRIGRGIEEHFDAGLRKPLRGDRQRRRRGRARVGADHLLTAGGEHERGGDPRTGQTDHEIRAARQRRARLHGRRPGSGGRGFISGHPGAGATYRFRICTGESAPVNRRPRHG